MKKVIFVVIVFAVTLATLPFYSGNKVKQNLHSIVSSLNEYPGYQASIVEHSKGWLSSSAKISIEYELIPSQEGNQPSIGAFAIPLEVEFSHGPLLFNDTATVGWFSYTTHIEDSFINVSKDELTLIDSAQLLTSSGFMNLGGHMQFISNVAAFTYAPKSSDTDLAVNFGGVAGDGTYSSAGLLEGTFELGAINIQNNDDKVVVSPSHMSFSADYAQQVSSMLMPSDFSYTLKKIEGDAEGKSFSLEDLTMSGAMDFPGDNPVFNMGFNSTIKSMLFDGQEVADTELSFSYDNISISVYEAYLKVLEESLKSGTQPSDILELFPEDELKKALLYNPGFSISNMQTTLPDGKLKGSMKVVLQPLQDFDFAVLTQNPKEILKMTTMSLNMASDKPIVHALMEPNVRAGIESQLLAMEELGQPQAMSQEEMEDLVEQSVLGSIQTMVQQGLIIDEDGQYISSFSYVLGEAKINGVDFPIEALLGSAIPQK